MKYQEKLKAIELRKQGNSYHEILRQIHVSKSTLSLWLRDVELTAAQKQDLYITRPQLARYKTSKRRQQERIDLTNLIIIESKEEAKKLAHDSFFVAGVMLYWAEGSKSETTERTQFCNSDPKMIRIMMQWFRKYCNIEEKKFTVTIHAHSLHCRKEIEIYWSDITGIPLTQFYKTQIKPTSLGHRKNKLYNGTCAVRIYNKNVFRKIKGWKLGLTEYFESICSGS